MKRLLTSKDVASLLQISLGQLCRMTKAGKIPAKDIGLGGKNHVWRYDEEKLEEWFCQEPQRHAPPRRRNRTSTAVIRSIPPKEKIAAIQRVNGDAQGTEDPADQR